MAHLVIDTLQSLIEGGYCVTAYCNADTCRHSSKLDLVALAERLGLDFHTIGDPNPLAAKLRCAKCQGKAFTLILSPPDGYSRGGAPMKA